MREGREEKDRKRGEKKGGKREMYDYGTREIM